MKRLVVVPGKPMVRYLIIAAFTGLLVGCGGGSSGDSDDDLDLDLDPIFDPDDVDGDGILNEFDEDFVAGDADGDGFTDPSPSTPCGLSLIHI